MIFIIKTIHIFYTVMKKAQNIIFQFLNEISSRFNLRTKIVEKEWKLFMKNPTPIETENTFIRIVLIDESESQGDGIPKGSESQGDGITKGSESQGDGITEKNLTCIFEYRNAPNKGRVCGVSIKSGNVCSKHKNHKNSIKTSKTSTMVETPMVTEVVKEEPKKPLMISLNYRVDKYIHQESGMVFFSKEERVVFGRYDKYKQKIFPLNDQDLDTCLKYGFRVDKTKWTGD